VLGDSVRWASLLLLQLVLYPMLCGGVPARGGCYSVGAIGSGVCREARDGACVWYAKEDKTDKASARVIRAGAGDTCPKVSDSSTQTTGICKMDKCDVTIGGSQYCSECSMTTEFPINGVCTTEKDNNAGCTTAGKCTSCGDGYFLHKGGCYKKGQQPGQTICTDTSSTQGHCKSCASGYFNNPAATDNTKESCIACGDTTGANYNKGVLNCKTCTKPETSGSSGAEKTATCTACAGGYYGTAAGSGVTCTQCTDPCATCTGAENTKCTSCKDTNPYFKEGDANDGTGTCITAQQCSSTHFPTTDKTSQKKICTPCSDAANGGIADCQTCSKTGDTLKCLTCTTDTKKPNKAGSKCFDCQVTDCSHCSADGVCEACSGDKKVSPGGSSCVTACPENSTASEGACICNSGFAPSGDSCAASSSTNLSTGAIAGISVAAVVVVGGLVGFLCWWFVCRGKA
ncbi:Variant-specific surface protein, partial [Giardia duodenalis]